MAAVNCLVVDDDVEILAGVQAYLRRFGMRTGAAANGQEMRRQMQSDSYDLVLLDLMLPDENGLELCKWVRRTSGVPVIMLTAHGDPISSVLGLEVGADDYIGKPFEPRVLVARIHAVLRRAQGASHGVTEPGLGARFLGWTFDRMLRQLVSPTGVLMPLSAAESRLLTVLLAHPGQVLSRRQLFALTHTAGAPVNERNVDLAISRLRAKLGVRPQGSAAILTVRGQGYVLNLEDAT